MPLGNILLFFTRKAGMRAMGLGSFEKQLGTTLVRDIGTTP